MHWPNPSGSYILLTLCLFLIVLKKAKRKGSHGMNLGNFSCTTCCELPTRAIPLACPRCSWKPIFQTHLREQHEPRCPAQKRVLGLQCIPEPNIPGCRKFTSFKARVKLSSRWPSEISGLVFKALYIDKCTCRTEDWSPQKIMHVLLAETGMCSNTLQGYEMHA